MFNPNTYDSARAHQEHLLRQAESESTIGFVTTKRLQVAIAVTSLALAIIGLVQMV